MSNLIVITAQMHKIADFYINVKYRSAGNVVKYIPVEFEIFRDGEYFKAIPAETDESIRLTDLPKQLAFQVQNGTVYTFNKTGKEEVVEDIVNKLFEMNVMDEVVQKKVSDIRNISSTCTLCGWIPDLRKGFNLKRPVFFTMSEQKFIELCRSKYLEMNKLNEIKNFHDYENQFYKIVNELAQKLSENMISAIPVFKRSSSNLHV